MPRPRFALLSSHPTRIYELLSCRVPGKHPDYPLVLCCVCAVLCCTRCKFAVLVSPFLGTRLTSSVTALQFFVSLSLSLSVSVSVSLFPCSPPPPPSCPRFDPPPSSSLLPPPLTYPSLLFYIVFKAFCLSGFSPSHPNAALLRFLLVAFFPCKFLLKSVA